MGRGLRCIVRVTAERENGKYCVREALRYYRSRITRRKEQRVEWRAGTGLKKMCKNW